VSLDDSSAENGPLRVLPDTHRGGLLSESQIERLAREVVPVDCVACSGSVIAMRPLTVHSSSKATSEQPRRVLHVEYAPAVDLGAGIELATAYRFIRNRMKLLRLSRSTLLGDERP